MLVGSLHTTSARTILQPSGQINRVVRRCRELWNGDVHELGRDILFETSLRGIDVRFETYEWEKRRMREAAREAHHAVQEHVFHDVCKGVSASPSTSKPAEQPFRGLGLLDFERVLRWWEKSMASIVMKSVGCRRGL